MTKAFFMWTANTDVLPFYNFFMLNSAEHEICPTHKINVKMQKIVGILTFIGRLNDRLLWFKPE